MCTQLLTFSVKLFLLYLPFLRLNSEKLMNVCTHMYVLVCMDICMKIPNKAPYTYHIRGLHHHHHRRRHHHHSEHHHSLPSPVIITISFTIVKIINLSHVTTNKTTIYHTLSSLSLQSLSYIKSGNTYQSVSSQLGLLSIHLPLPSLQNLPPLSHIRYNWYSFIT